MATARALRHDDGGGVVLYGGGAGLLLSPGAGVGDASGAISGAIISGDIIGVCTGWLVLWGCVVWRESVLVGCACDW